MPDKETRTPAGRNAGDPGLRGWVEYLRDMGVYDLYLREDPGVKLTPAVRERLLSRAAPVRTEQPSAETPQTATLSRTLVPAEAVIPGRPSPLQRESRNGQAQRPPTEVVAEAPGKGVGAARAAAAVPEPPRSYFNTEDVGMQALPPELVAPMPKPNALESLLPQPTEPIPPAQRGEALERLRAEIGDCTRCPLAYAGRHTIVFGEGDPNAALLFVGEGPGADEDASGRPFIGKAGQLLNNMIGAMGLSREQVYIANIVKCRPPGNRTPEFAEATTCAPFLLQQIDIVRPRVIVALGSTAATYVLGVRQSLASLRGQWFASRGAKVAVTYHPAFLLRDPRQKAEAWKDLQRVMVELGLQPAAKR